MPTEPMVTAPLLLFPNQRSTGFRRKTGVSGWPKEPLDPKKNIAELDLRFCVQFLCRERVPGQQGGSERSWQ
jgi:hypothetical protein